MGEESPSAQPSAAVEIAFHLRGIALVTLRGEHDSTGDQLLREKLAAASRQLNVLVDLSGCWFIDSSVIAALFLAHKRLVEHGGRLAVFIPQEAATVQRVAKAAALGAVLPVYETRSAALSSFQPVEHAIRIRDLRHRFGDPDAHSAECTCGWHGETHFGQTAARAADRDGAVHLDRQRITPTASRRRGH